MERKRFIVGDYFGICQMERNSVSFAVKNLWNECRAIIPQREMNFMSGISVLWLVNALRRASYPCYSMQKSEPGDTALPFLIFTVLRMILIKLL